METNLAQLNYKTLENDKYYFAAYLNMARHNAFITLSALNIKFSPNTQNDSEDNLSEFKVMKMLSNVEKPELVLKAFKRIDKHFPFLKAVFSSQQFKENSKNENLTKNPDLNKDYQEVLTLFLDQLDSYRNYYSHIDHAPIHIEEKLAFYLQKIFEASVTRAKTNNQYTDEEINHLVPFLFKRKDGKVEKTPNPSFRYSFTSNNELSLEGLAFFTCLFLEKQYASEFLGCLKNFKDRRERYYRATIDTYKTYSIDIPFDRIESTEPSFTLGLNMLNELNRCPEKLLDHLSKNDQNRFRIKDEDSIDEMEPEEDSHPDSFLLKRYSDRFPYFALRYIDRMDVFKFIRFQVDMGSYYYKFYPKTMVDGEDRLRSLNIHIKAFGKLEELDQKRKELWKDLIVYNPPEGLDREYITDTYPHYHFNNNQIGLKITDSYKLPELKQQETGLLQPDAWLSNYELPGMLFLAWLSREEKPNRAETIIRDYIANVRKLFDHISQGIFLPQGNTDMAQKALNPYHIELVNLPDEIKHYLCGRASLRNEKFQEHAHRMITLLLHQTERYFETIENKIHRIKGKGNKVGKKKFVEIKSGVLADFLAKDMIMFQPSLSIDKDGKKDGRDKITGANFHVLQARLAFYGRDYHMLPAIFSQCGLTHGENQHPFLKDIDPLKYNEIISFYLAYLSKRKKYLENCLKQKQYKQYYFLKPESKKWSSDADFQRLLAERYNKLPVNLPRGLFLDALKDWFLQSEVASIKTLIQSNSRINTIYLLQKYMELEKADGSQSFYNYKRSYPCIDKLTGIRRGTSYPQIFFTQEQLALNNASWKKKIAHLPSNPLHLRPSDHSLYKEPMQGQFADFMDNEKVLRLIRAQDLLQFLLARELFLKEKVQSLNLDHDESVFRLNAIGPDNDTGTLSMQIPCELKVHGKTITYVTKIKNYGNFVRFTRDRRLKGLFEYIADDTLEFAVVKRELHLYDKARLEISNQIHRFEKAVLKNLSVEIKAEKDRKKEEIKQLQLQLQYEMDKQNLKTIKRRIDKSKSAEQYTDFETICRIFGNVFPGFELQLSILLKIRNRFMHNEYPNPPDVKEERIPIMQVALTLQEKVQQLVDQFTELFHVKVER